jgi:hypothetical protein
MYLGKTEDTWEYRCNAVCTFVENKFKLLLRDRGRGPESVATLPPFSPIEGQKWFDQISSQ